MTVLLDQAIHDLAENYGIEHRLEEEPVLEKVDEETWEEYVEYRQHLDRLDYLKCLLELEKIKGTVEAKDNANFIENDNRG